MKTKLEGKSLVELDSAQNVVRLGQKWAVVGAYFMGGGM
jgi:hypothetical protein